jgi:hypothetical protein
MENSQQQTVSIDGVEYQISDLSEKSKIYINHINDIDQKIFVAKFQLDQMQIGRAAFFELLKTEIQ